MTGHAQPSKNSWNGILAADERIIWQGQPSQKLSAKPGEVLESLFGVFFTGFSIFWMVMASSMGGGPFWMFGLIFFFAGLYQVFGKYLWRSYQRGHTWYTLTSANAYIGMDNPIGRRSLKTYPITRDTPLQFEQGALSSIYFSEASYVASGKSRTTRVGFENLENGQDVYDKFLSIRKAQA